MSRKKKILLVVLGILFLILLFSLVWFLQNARPVPTTVVLSPEKPTVQTSRDETQESSVVSEPIETKDIDVALQTLAVSFAERYGSYSTESSFANLYDILPMMTAALRSQTEDFIAKSSVSSLYYGVTTRVLSVDVSTSDKTMATVTVSTQREESKGSAQNSEIKYQDLFLTCVEENGVWKVSSAIWQ
jgi:hypothetical protein